MIFQNYHSEEDFDPNALINVRYSPLKFRLFHGKKRKTEEFMRLDRLTFYTQHRQHANVIYSIIDPYLINTYTIASCSISDTNVVILMGVGPRAEGMVEKWLKTIPAHIDYSMTREERVGQWMFTR